MSEEKQWTKEEIEEKIKELESNKFMRKLTEKMQSIISIIGFVLSTLGAIGYMVTIITIVTGVGDVQFELIGKDGMFFAIGMVFGLLIRSGFYIQGVTFAKNEFKPVLDEYYSFRVYETKEKKKQSFEFKMGIEIARTTVIQILTFAISSMGLVYLAGFEGINNGVYIGNAISNLFMFTGFGFLALNSAYEKYIIYKIPRIKEEIRKMKLPKEEPKHLVIDNV